MTKRLPAMAFTAALLIGGIGVTSAAPASAKAKPHHKAKPKPKPKKAAPGIGSTQTVLNQDKQTETVKLVAVIDPAQGSDEFNTPDAGKRFVAVEIQITNKSKGVDSNSADDNLSVVGSNKQGYSPDLSTVSECTDFNNGTYTLSKGSTEIGCVTYQIPTGVGVAKVQYNPDAGFSTNNAQWTLSPAL